MNYENIEKASKMLGDIKTLEQEVEAIERACKRGSYLMQNLMRKLLLKKPVEKTYKNYWCSADLDCIHSCIVINEREAMAVVEVKKQEIEELDKQIDELMRGEEDE